VNQTTLMAQLDEGRQVDADGVGSLTVMAVGIDQVPIGIGVVAPLAGPNPLLETKSEFLERAVGASGRDTSTTSVPVSPSCSSCRLRRAGDASRGSPYQRRQASPGSSSSVPS
jgi:hypothetical protein